MQLGWWYDWACRDISRVELVGLDSVGLELLVWGKVLKDKLVIIGLCCALSVSYTTLLKNIFLPDYF